MAASAWKVFGIAKKKLGQGGLTLSAGFFKMALHLTAASAVLSQMKSVATTITAWSSIGNEVIAVDRYVTGGKRISASGSIWYSTGANSSTMKFRYTTAGVVWTASLSTIANIRYAVIVRNTSATGVNGIPICYAALSTAAFSLTSPNTLTVLPAATGVFTLGG